MPTHAHGQGYSDLNFLIPELVTGVQFSKGPYFAEQGDFATAGASNINYATMLDRPIAHVDVGGDGFGRVAARGVAGGRRAATCWRRSRRRTTTVRGRSPTTTGSSTASCATAAATRVNGVRDHRRWAYHGEWNSTDQLAVARRRRGPDRPLRRDRSRPTAATRYRYSGSVDWQQGTQHDADQGDGVRHRLRPRPVFELHVLPGRSRSRRSVRAGRPPVHQRRKVIHRRVTRWGGRAVQNTFGVQLRNDDIANVGLYHTEAARAARHAESGRGARDRAPACYAQNEVEWTPWLRTHGRSTRRRRAVPRGRARSGQQRARARTRCVSPKGGVTFGPWRGTEFYVNAGSGFHSNDARGTTITRDRRTATPVEPVTPLVRAKGAEVGVRTVALPHLQTTAHVLDAAARFGARLRRRRRDHRAEPAERALRRRVDELLQSRSRGWCSTSMSRSRTRASPTPTRRQSHPRSGGTVLSAGASVDNSPEGLREPALALFRSARAGRGQLASGPVRRACSTSRRAISSPGTCG